MGYDGDDTLKYAIVDAIYDPTIMWLYRFGEKKLGYYIPQTWLFIYFKSLPHVQGTRRLEL